MTLNIFTPEYRYETINLHEEGSPVNHKSLSATKNLKYSLKQSASARKISHNTVSKLESDLRSKFSSPSNQKHIRSYVRNPKSCVKKINYTTKFESQDGLKSLNQIMKAHSKFLNSSFENVKKSQDQADTSIESVPKEEPISLRVYSPNMVKNTPHITSKLIPIFILKRIQTLILSLQPLITCF